jgi:hypothetical protein
VHNKSSLITRNGFVQLSPPLVLMAMECVHDHSDGMSKHTHENLPDWKFFLDRIFQTFSSASSNYSLITLKDFEMIYKKLDIHVDHDHKASTDSEFGSVRILFFLSIYIYFKRCLERSSFKSVGRPMISLTFFMCTTSKPT